MSRTIEQQSADWNKFDRIAKRSRLTKKDALELPKKVDAEMAKHFCNPE